MSSIKTYLVGGAVRDKLLCIEPKDLDYVVTGVTPEQMIEKGYSQVGADFPVFLHPETRDEYALARIERKSGQGYHGFEVNYDTNVTIEDDLSRRDLTINSMAMDDKGTIIDPFNGQEDLKNKILRHTTEAFKEDPLRVLRICRFASRYTDFDIANETIEIMKELVKSGELNHLVKERVWAELEKTFCEKDPTQFFKNLDKCSGLDVLFPEIKEMIGVPQRADYHAEGDVFVHTMMVIEKAREIAKNNNYNTQDTIDIVASALWHDVGKAKTSNDLLYHEDGSVKGYHHGHDDEELVMPILESLHNRIRIPKKTFQFIKDVALIHQKVHRIKESSRKGVVRLFNEFSINNKGKDDYIEKIADACYADALGRKLTIDNEIKPAPTKYEQKDLLINYYKAYRSVSVGPWVKQYTEEKGYAPRTDLIQTELHRLRLNAVGKLVEKKSKRMNKKI